jgi:hypothetical protein
VVFSAELEEYPARFLKKFGVDAKMLRRGVKQKRGFRAEDIERAARRYLKAG